MSGEAPTVLEPEQTEVWRDALGAPAVLERLLDERDGIAAVAGALSGRRRLVVTGNGAAYYVALALWAAALHGTPSGPDVVAVPAGLLARGRFRWRDGDAALVVSSSGELRDAIEAVDAGVPRPLTVLTATPESTLGRAADERVLVPVARQVSDTHTQGYLGNVLAALAVWARVSDDPALGAALEAAPAAVRDGLDRAPGWAAEAIVGLAPPPAATAFGPGPAWPAALEAALLCKEVAGIPTEGMEAREGATSGMYALAPGHLAISLPCGGAVAGPGSGEDPLLLEAERVCRGTGATVLRLPGGDARLPADARLPGGDASGGSVDPRLAPVTTFPAALALALHLAALRGVDPDRPAWSAAYYATTRTHPEIVR